MIFRERGFTLVELLVVVAIVGLLAMILMPVLARGKGAAQRAVSTNNVKQVVLANFLYMQDNDDSIAPNRSCNLMSGPGVPGMDVFCVRGRVVLGWIDLTVPYVKSYEVFKSPADPTRPVGLPPGSLDVDGRVAPHGLIWSPRPNGEVFGGEFRSSYARNNNFANNGTYTAVTSRAEFPSHTVMIYSFTANSGAGASGNEGTPGSSFTIVRREGVQPEPGQCLAYDPTSAQNHMSNFFDHLPAVAQRQERRWPSAERYFGRGLYGFLDGHVKAYRPEAVRGQCGWGHRAGGVETGNDGTAPDFRF